MSYINAIRSRDDIIVWERKNGKREVISYKSPYYLYIKSDTGEYTSIYGDKLQRLDFANAREFNTAKARFDSMRIEMFESDIQPELKLLSDKYYGVPAPKLHVTFYDVENDYDLDKGYASMEDPYAPINSVALYHEWQNRMVVYAVPPEEYKGSIEQADILKRMDEIATLPTDCEVEVYICDNEEELLLCFLKEIEDSDVMSGWNSYFFDDPYISKRIEMLSKRLFNKLSFDEGNIPRFKEVQDQYGGDRIVVDWFGRIQADYLQVFKKYEGVERRSFTLESIAAEILVDPSTGKPLLPKLEYEGSLARQYKKDFMWFIRYNLRDTEILKGFEERLGYIELANQMYHLSTGLFKHVTGTIKLSELATINYCHHELDNLIVNDVREARSSGKAKGAFVLLPQVGEHKWAGAIDIKSLYPSAIRSINISPETLIGQFSEDEKAFHMIRDRGWQNLTLVMDNGQSVTKPADEWRTFLIASKWAISGFGTVFDQEKQGIMPAILEYWYATRKKYKKLMEESKASGDVIKEQYYDKLQYVYKIKLNSYYGSLLNEYFRFYDKRLGESATGTSRAILLHQCSKVAELLDGKYAPTDVEKIDKNGVKHIGYSDKWSVLYGDSVAGDTKLILENGLESVISDLFKCVDERHNNGKEYHFPKNVKTLTYDEKKNKSTFEEVLYVMRHKTTKKMYRVWITNSTYVDVTEDHSLMGYRETGLEEIKPEELLKDANATTFVVNDHGNVIFSHCNNIRVEEIEYDDYVYDIEVGNTHVFFANNILVHNTDSTYFLTHAKDEDESCLIADAVGEQCSASFPAFMRDAFLCTDGFAEIIETTREIVSDNGIFVDKKRYFLHIVDNEGYKCDKIKVMGLDTKKTTLPKKIAAHLNGLVAKYLKGAEWDEIALDLVAYKEILFNTKNIMSIGLPKGVKKVEQYTKAYAENTKTFLPGHVSASIHYNEMLIEYDDVESLQIKSGMKIKVFYLNQNYGRFKAIAIPVDIEIVPQWFLDNFTINRGMHIKRLVDNPMNNIIKAIDKLTPSKQSLHTDDLLGM